MTISHKYSPYVFIAILCVVVGIFRGIILIDFPWYVHIISFFGQFITMSAIWQLVGFINHQLEKKFSFEQRPATQIALQVLVTIVLLSPVFITSFLLARPYLPSFVDSRVLALFSILLIMALMVMTFGYYTYDLFIKNKNAREEKARMQLEAAQLEKEKSMMQYHHLKNQVNPHFLFNTLASLDGLIQSNPNLASEFVKHLSKVYRYVLEHKENEVVNMQTELNFIQHYISLLQIRYKDSIQIKLSVSAQGMEKGIVMVTLQMLIDNAIKHNIVQSESPLHISICDEGDYLYIRNNKQLRKQIETSNKHGLQQLQQLYSFITAKPVLINDGKDFFEVKLPLL